MLEPFYFPSRFLDIWKAEPKAHLGICTLIKDNWAIILVIFLPFSSYYLPSENHWTGVKKWLCVADTQQGEKPKQAEEFDHFGWER